MPECGLGLEPAGGSVLNAIWVALILISVLWAAFTGRMEAVGQEALQGAENAVALVVKLTGVMALFLGLMRVARDGGLLHWVTRALAPLMRRLFPEVPADSPAMSAMIMNLASNALGLGNAATPFGLKAMVELERLNRTPGSASNAMVLFLAINASSVTLVPSGVIALRAAMGSEAAVVIWLPTLVATCASTLAAVTAALLLQQRARFAPSTVAEALPPPATADDTEIELPPPPTPLTAGTRFIVFGVVGALLVALVLHVVRSDATSADLVKELAGGWFLPIFITVLLIFGISGRVRAYEAAVEGAREALEVAVRIIPFLVMILAALAMLRASGALEAFIAWIGPATAALGLPAEVLPMAVLRPLSGSGAYGVLVETMETHGPDSFIGLLVSSLQGSTETTFYVLTLYLGAARVRDARHALPACLCGDLAGLVAATAACHVLFG